MSSATEFIWKTFQQTSNADRKDIPKVSLYIDSTDGVVAYAANNEIHYSANAIQQSTGNVKTGFAGVMYHEMTHVWQWNGNGQPTPGGLIEGIADFVRLKAGYAPSHWVKPGQGDRWDKGYDVTAYFLDYCDGLKSGFVAELNKKMRTGYNVNYFVELLGKTVDQLWSDYKAKGEMGLWMNSNYKKMRRGFSDDFFFELLGRRRWSTVDQLWNTRLLSITNGWANRTTKQSFVRPEESYLTVDLHYDLIKYLIRTTPKLSLFIETLGAGQVAFSSDEKIRVNADYIQGFSGDAPVGLIDGITDFLRLKAGYVPDYWRQPGSGNRWDEGYDVVAWFLDYCTQAVQYTVTKNLATTPGGAKFTNLGIAYSKQAMSSATDFIWKTFQQTSNANRKNVPKWNGNGQTPSELIEGIADFARLKAGYAPGHWVKPGKGDRWDQGYDVTAHFLDYCEGLRSGFVAELNKKMRTGYRGNYFVELLGKSGDQLWSDYKAKYNGNYFVELLGKMVRQLRSYYKTKYNSN
ncbi:hypothetical protein RHSIM_Rhsim11G0159200 [Rhododendron simsii]|uniref:Uncharacterized protein n=1 Tax=Rhododendron simsii TaxID=118357 RepID=A0A834GAY6_RHOSS|nr:hypothetical protein RHSIM_Rhsim11G0159200 [Rhododendron simsii]